MGALRMGRYNDRIRALGGNKRGKRQFIQLYRNVKRSKNYHGLSAYARALLSSTATMAATTA